MIPDEQSRIKRARMLMAVDQHADAERELHLLLAQSPQSADGHAWLGYCKMLRGKFHESFPRLRQALGLRPEDAFLHYLLSQAYCGIGDYEAAHRSINEALQYAPDHADYIGMSAKLFAIEHKWQKVIDTTGRALALDPQNLLSLKWRAVALFELDRSKESEETTLAALKVAPHDDFFHSLLAEIKLEHGKAHAAFDSFRESVRINPNEDSRKAGMAKAMLARTWFYNLYLRHLSSRRTFPGINRIILLGFTALLIIGAFFQPLPAGANAIVLVALTFWIVLYVAQPIGVLALSFSSYWRRILDDDKTYLIGATILGLFIIGLGVALLLDEAEKEWGIPVIIYGVTIIVLFGGMYNRFQGESQMALLVGLVFLLVCGSIGFAFPAHDFRMMKGFGIFSLFVRWRLDAPHIATTSY